MVIGLKQKDKIMKNIIASACLALTIALGGCAGTTGGAILEATVSGPGMDLLVATALNNPSDVDDKVIAGAATVMSKYCTLSPTSRTVIRTKINERLKIMGKGQIKLLCPGDT